MEDVIFFFEEHGGGIMLVIPLIFIFMDVITGVIKAVSQQDVSSSELRKGAIHKLGLISAIAFTFCLEFFMSTCFGISFPILIPAVCYIIFSECVSIIENIVIVNPQLEGIFAPILRIVQNSKDQKIDDITKIGGTE